jgi:hypothetical protein
MRYAALSIRQKEKKEEFPGIMEDMMPGNSFPQICVVSVSDSAENAYMTPEYAGSASLSNQRCY